MKIENPYENMANFYHDNPSMMELYEYRNTDIYKEIVLFLNDFNKDWRKKKELGEYAADFILRIIKEFEEEQEDENKSFVQWLTNIYEEIADRYATTKSNYQFARGISQDIKSLMEECTTDDDFLEDEFEKAYKKHLEDEDEKICVFF